MAAFPSSREGKVATLAGGVVVMSGAIPSSGGTMWAPAVGAVMKVAGIAFFFFEGSIRHCLADSRILKREPILKPSFSR